MAVLFEALSLLIFLIVEIESKKKKINNKIRESNQKSELIFWIQISVFALIGILALIFLIRYFLKKIRAEKEIAIRQILIKKQEERNRRQLKNKQYGSTLTPMQKQDCIKWFSNQKWVLEQKGKNIKTIPLKIKKISRVDFDYEHKELTSKDVYDAFEISMSSGIDGFGNELLGFIMFEKYYMSICFEFSSSNLQTSEGMYDFVWFEGIQKVRQFEGTWCYQNGKKVQQGGEWKLIK